MHFDTLTYRVLFFLAVSLALGCHAQKALTRAELAAVPRVEAVAPERRPVEVKTLTGGILMSLGGVVTGPVGAALDESASHKMQSHVELADFGELLVRDVAERAPKEVPGWPPTTVSQASSKHGVKGGAVLTFDIANPSLTVLRGFTVEVTGTLTDASGKTLWSKYFWYRSWDFGRSGDQKEYLKDDYALLKREIELAAKDTATLMLRDLAQGL